MKILHIDESFHTQYGYHTAPLAKMQARQGHEVTVITVPADKLYPVFSEFGDNTPAKKILEYDREFEQRYNVKIVRVPIIRYISGRAVYKRDVFNKIKEIDPDVILCHNTDSLIAIKLIMKKPRYPVLYDSHMLAMASKNKLYKLYRVVYRLFITPRIKSLNLTIIRTQDDPYLNECLGIPKKQTPFISFGTDTQLFSPNEEVRRKIRREYGIGDNDFVVVYTGKLTEAKGAEFFANAIKKKIKTDIYDNVIFLIVGNTTGEYGNKIDNLFSQSENRIIREPAQKYVDLPPFYQVADLSVFPKQCSMSFYDAQACGLPVVFEDNGVNIGRSKAGNAITFHSGDAEDFAAAISKCANMDKLKYGTMRKNSIEYIKKSYDYTDIAEQYTNEMVETREAFIRRK